MTCNLGTTPCIGLVTMYSFLDSSSSWHSFCHSHVIECVNVGYARVMWQGLDFWWFSQLFLLQTHRIAPILGSLATGMSCFLLEVDGCCRSRCLVGKRVKEMQDFMGGDTVEVESLISFSKLAIPKLVVFEECIWNEGILVRLFEYSLSSCQDHWGGMQNCSKQITKTSYSHKD